SKDTTGRANVYKQRGTLFLWNVQLKNPIKNLLNYGRYAWSPFQIIDETGYNGRVSFQLPGEFKNFAQVNHFLKDFDLEVILEYRWQDVIVIKEPDKGGKNL